MFVSTCGRPDNLAASTSGSASFSDCLQWGGFHPAVLPHLLGVSAIKGIQLSPVVATLASPAVNHDA